MLRLTRTVRGCLAWALVAFVAMLCAPPAGAEGILVSTELSAPLNPNGTVRQWDVSPDGRYAVWIADPVGREEAELYSRRLDGGEYVTLVRIFMHDESVRSFRISPDSQYVVLTIGKFEDPQWRVVRLLSVPIGGGDPVLLNIPAHDPPLPTISSYVISPDSARVAYVMDRRTAGVGELYSVPIGGGPSELLVGLDAMCAPCVITYEFTPNGEHVLFERTESPSSTTLAMVPAAGGSETVLSADDVLYAQSSPNGAGAVYCRRTASETFGLFAVLYDDPDHPWALSPPWSSPIGFQISPDSTRVVYTLTDETTRTGSLYSVPTLPRGSPSVTLSGPLAAGTYVDSFLIAPNGLGVVYTARRYDIGTSDLYGVPIAGGDPVRLSHSLDGGQVSWFQVLSNSQGVAYLASAGDAPRRQLYVRLFTAVSPVRLNARLALKGGLQTAAISPNSGAVVYSAAQAPDGVLEAYVSDGVHVLRIGPLFPISPGTMLNPYERLFEITPDSQGVVYRADPTGSGHWRLHLARGVAFYTYTPMVLR